MYSGVCVNTTILFEVIGCVVDTMQSPCGPGAYTLAEKNAKKNKNVSKNTASSSKQYYLLEYLVFFVKEPADKKNKK